MLLLLLLLRFMLAVRAFTALALRMRDRKVPDRALGVDMKDVAVVVQVDAASTIELKQMLHTLFRLAFTQLTHVVVLLQQHEVCAAINSHQCDAASRDIQLLARPRWADMVGVGGGAAHRRQRRAAPHGVGACGRRTPRLPPPFGRAEIRYKEAPPALSSRCTVYQAWIAHGAESH